MRIKLLIFFTIVIFDIEFISCSEGKEPIENFDIIETKHILDSLKAEVIAAAYKEESCFCVFVRLTDNLNGIKKLTFRRNFPVYVDTLLYKNKKAFYSKKINSVYLIKDTSIIQISYVKIIHPSSNWQGQTPWVQPYVTTYNRLDRAK